MHQKRYALEILNKFEMEHCNMEITHTYPKLQLSKNEDEQAINPTQYMKLIGSSWCLCNTRSNLEFSVGILRRFMGKPKASHLEAVKRILRYIKGSIRCRILFPATDKGRTCKLLDYTDSNWCEDKDDIKFIVGYIFIYEETSYIGVLRRKKLWRYLLARSSALQRLCVYVSSYMVNEI